MNGNEYENARRNDDPNDDGPVEPPAIYSVESPDDWVTQDIVPMRVDDQFSWSFSETREWSITTEHVIAKYAGLARHGWIDPNDNSTLSVRCRRKNLPVAVPSIKRVPVRLWINEEDGWLFASPDQVLASDQEILHDADGFFVESPAIDPNDMPLNPVPGKVVATGTKTPQPVESPDDWVEITDSHPGHIRRLCDQVCDKYARESIHNWHYVGGGDACTVGYSQHAYPMSRIRCRRKNLPVAVPSIITEYVGSRPGLEGPYRRKTKAVEPPAIDPGEGWELLPVGTMLEQGDEFLEGKTWILTGNASKDKVKCNTYRRKSKPVPAQTTVSAHDWPEDASHENGNYESVMSSSAYVNRQQLTEAEALARVPPAESRDGDCIHDIPLNPVPGKVVATGTVKLTPVESPDDWVEITDPGHVLRAGVDQLRVSVIVRTFSAGHGGFRWEYAKRSAGSCLSDIGVRECRCRRRDLPVAVPATSETITADTDNMAAIIAEHTQQVRELTQRIGELVQQVNERDAVIEKILPHCRPAACQIQIVPTPCLPIVILNLADCSV